MTFDLENDQGFFLNLSLWYLIRKVKKKKLTLTLKMTSNPENDLVFFPKSFVMAFILKSKKKIDLDLENYL